MSPTLQDLLLRWEQMRQGGNSVSVEELCRDCPELRAELLSRIRALEKVNQVLDTGDGQGLTTPPAHPRTRYDELRPGGEPIPGYRLEKRLGRGGFGEVWKATGPGGFAAALKFVPLSGRLGANELRSLEVIKTLHHPNLLATFGSWQAHGFLVIAMELADRTLMDRFQEALGQGLSGIPMGELLGYMREAAKGIDYLNQPGPGPDGGAKQAVQHRDIKPQNILLMGGGVKIADFGLVRVLKNTVAGHTGMLTPAYAAPEFLMGHTARSSDQYSLALTYFQLRAGRLPFAGSPDQLMKAQLEGEPDLTMLSQAEREPVARALRKDPKQRWATCTEFVKRIAQCATDATTVCVGAPMSTSWSLPCEDGSGVVATRCEETPTRNTPLLSDASTKRRRFRPVTLVGFLAGILLLSIVAWALMAKMHQEPPPNREQDGAVQATSPDATAKAEPAHPMQHSEPPQAGHDNGDATPKPGPDDLMKRELAHLQGTWLLRSRSFQGKRVSFRYMEMRIEGNRMIFSYMGKPSHGFWIFDIDPTKNPKTLDTTRHDAHGHPFAVHSIYRIEGNQITWADAPTGTNSRPTEFTSHRGSNILVETWQRK